MLELPAQLTHRQARVALAQLLAALPGASGADVQIDARGLQEFDSSALAVLLECRRAALAAGKGFAVQGLPAGLQSMAGLYGVQGLLLAP